jgi:lysophospholipid acyltransferase (LPLAT)-like uncharacterized protein
MCPLKSVPPRELVADFRFRAAGRLGAAILRLLGATWTLDWIGDERGRFKEGINGGRVIWAFWHGMILPLTYAQRNRNIVVLVSRHRDGEIISQIVCRMGTGVVRGSSSRGGLRALLQMIRAGKEGHPLAVTPDGPRGPRASLQPGILHIAQRSGLPIVPLAAAAVRSTRLNSWDRFLIPHPFSRVAVVVGSPILVPKDLQPGDLETTWGPIVQSALRDADATAEAWRLERVRG